MYKLLLVISSLLIAFLVGEYSTAAAPKVGQRIVGGANATITDYPWQVSVEHNESHVCGASIIAEYWTLSAAHCADEVLSLYRIRAGSSKAEAEGILHDVELKVVHERYDSFTFDYDFALFKVLNPFAFQEGIGVIGLPVQDQSLNDDSVGVTTGWGSTATGSGISHQLQVVSLPIMSKALCEASYASQQTITERMFCAGKPEGGISACSGDSGGPLVVRGQLLGVVSWGGIPCGNRGDPTVFARVSYVRDWIDLHAETSRAATQVSFLFPLPLYLVYLFLQQIVTL